MADFDLPFEFFLPILVGVSIYGLYFIGAFTSIKFQPSSINPMVFVYKTYKGPFSEVGTPFSTTIEFMKKHGFETSKTPSAGMYYDDPKTTDIPRYAVGFVFGQTNDAAKKKWEKFQQENEDEAKEWSVLELKQTPTIVSIFPMRWTAISCALSAMKTYPAFEAAGYQLKSGSMEIYRSDNKTVETHFPQGNYEQFCAQESDVFTPTSDKQKVQ